MIEENNPKRPMNKIVKDKLSLFSRLMEFDYTKNFYQRVKQKSS